MSCTGRPTRSIPLKPAINAIAHATNVAYFGPAASTCSERRRESTPMGAGINSAEPVFGDDGVVVDDKSPFQLELVGQQVVEFARMRSAGTPV